MTQEDKELLLVDLCARLPYGVICYDEAQNETGIFKQFEYEGFGRIHNGRGMRYIEHIHPILRPISSMTDEEMDRLFDILHIDKDGKDEDWIKINDVYGIKFFFPTGKWIENVAEAYDYLYSIHIDFRGLIHKGLAIEVTEDNNPYKD